MEHYIEWDGITSLLHCFLFSVANDVHTRITKIFSNSRLGYNHSRFSRSPKYIQAGSNSCKLWRKKWQRKWTYCNHLVLLDESAIFLSLIRRKRKLFGNQWRKRIQKTFTSKCSFISCFLDVLYATTIEALFIVEDTDVGTWQIISGRSVDDHFHIPMPGIMLVLVENEDIPCWNWLQRRQVCNCCTCTILKVSRGAPYTDEPLKRRLRTSNASHRTFMYRKIVICGSIQSHGVLMNRGRIICHIFLPFQSYRNFLM